MSADRVRLAPGRLNRPAPFDGIPAWTLRARGKNVLATIGVHRAGAEEAVLLMLTIPSAWR